MQIKNLLILIFGVFALIVIVGGFKFIFTLSEMPLPSSSEQTSDSTWPPEIPVLTESMEMNSASFEEIGCFGTCPVYKMIITEDDRYIILPKMFTRLENEVQGQLPGGTFSELVKVVQKSQFDNRNIHYSERSKDGAASGCGTDSSTSILAVKTQEQIANFHMYWGCWDVTDMEDIQSLFKDIGTVLDLENLVYPIAEDKEQLFK